MKSFDDRTLEFKGKHLDIPLISNLTGIDKITLSKLRKKSSQFTNEELYKISFHVMNVYVVEHKKNIDSPDWEYVLVAVHNLLMEYYIENYGAITVDLVSILMPIMFAGDVQDGNLVHKPNGGFFNPNEN